MARRQARMHMEIKRECKNIAIVENIDNIHKSTKLAFDGARFS
jgi:hypothetical protein